MKTPLELGDILKAARLEQKLELPELSARTGLPEKYLEALERGAHEELPGRAYARIYYLNYARALKLDHEGLMQSWPQQAVRPAESLPPRATRGKWRLFVWLGLPIAALAIWGLFRGPAPVRQRAVEEPDGLKPAPAYSFDTTAGGQDSMFPDSMAEAGAVDSVGASPQAESTQVAERSPVLHRLKLVARADTWIVIEADGDTVSALVLNRGEELNAEASSAFVLTVMLPKEVDATLDGAPLDMPAGGTRPLLRHKIELQSQEGGP